MTNLFGGMARALAGIALVAICTGCEPEKPTVHPVAQMAPFDLNCPQGYIRYFPLNETTYGVQGCGRQARYVKLCRTKSNPWNIDSTECQWVLN